MISDSSSVPAPPGTSLVSPVGNHASVPAPDPFFTSPLAHAELDHQWSVIRANQAWVALVGSAAGARWIDLVHPTDLATHLGDFGTFPEGEPRVVRLSARMRAGADGWRMSDLILSPTASHTISVLALPATTAPRVSGDLIDDRRQLASALSHDVRQHARLVSAYGSLLARSELDERQRRHVAVVVDHADRLQQVLTSLVRWLRLADEAPVIGSCDLAAAWREATADLAADILPSDLPVIRADPTLITDLLRELALNAVRYHPARVKLQCTVQWKPEYWLLEVADDGAGIPCHDRERVLAPLHRLHSWEQVPGHGMGLAIAARIAARHGGSLTITDAPLGGCMVQVLIPR